MLSTGDGHYEQERGRSRGYESQTAHQKRRYYDQRWANNDDKSEHESNMKECDSCQPGSCDGRQIELNSLDSRNLFQPYGKDDGRRNYGAILKGCYGGCHQHIRKFHCSDHQSEEVLCPAFDHISQSRGLRSKYVTAEVASFLPKADIDASMEVPISCFFKTKCGKEIKMIDPPCFSKREKLIRIIENCFKMSVENIAGAYHYDVDIRFLRQYRKDDQKMSSPKFHPESMSSVRKQTTGKDRCRQIIAELVRSTSLQKYNPIYDGHKNIYSVLPLPIEKKKNYIFSLDEGDHFEDFVIVIQPVEKKSRTGNLVNFGALRKFYSDHSNNIAYDVLMVLETLCHRYSSFYEIELGRSYFKTNQEHSSLATHDTPIHPLVIMTEMEIVEVEHNTGEEIWSDYIQSPHLNRRGLDAAFNYDCVEEVQTVVYRDGTVIDYVSDILGKDITKLTTLNPQEIEKLTQVLKNVRVEVTHLDYRRKYKVACVTDLAAKDIFVEIDDEDMTVSEYFLNTYDIDLEYPNLPCLHMKTSNNKTFLPMEVCEIVPGQLILDKLPDKMENNPEVRFHDIKDELQKLSPCDAASDLTSDELSFYLSMMLMQGRGTVAGW